jgi:proline utilization trans-activator
MYTKTFYSVALNRRNTAYTYTGIALRLSLILGLHRKIPNNTTMTPMECEHRIRVWWSVYSLDRVCSSKVGHPVMLRDEDIDVQLPSTDGLTPEQAAEYFDPVHLTAQIKLMRITGNVLSDIYRIPQPGRSNQFFVVGVQKTLANLRSWHEMLPPLLRLNHNASQMFANRSVASLHLHFCQVCHSL